MRPRSERGGTNSASRSGLSTRGRRGSPNSWPSGMASSARLRERQRRNYELREAAMNPRAREDGADFRKTTRTTQRSTDKMSTTSVFGVDPQEARDQALG